MNRQRDLVLMARAPEPGRTKTRLIPDLGDDGAALLAEAMLKDTVALAGVDPAVRLHIAIDEARDAEYFSALAPDANVFVQRGEKFGERLANAMCQVTKGDNNVIALGTDCPHMPKQVLVDAWDRMSSGVADVVLGPATDGGYYLIGWSTQHPEIVAPVEMSTPRVLADTTQLASELGVSVALLDPEFDIDDIDDVRRLTRLLSDTATGATFTRRVLHQLRL